MVAPSTSSSSKLKAKFSLDDFGLGEGWIILQRRWKIVALCVLGLWVSGLAYCYAARQKYQSKTQVLVMRKDTGLVTNTSSSNSPEPQVSEDLLATHMELIRSKNIVSNALSRTIRLSELNQLKSERKEIEKQTSLNLRFVVPRMIGWASGEQPSELQQTSTTINQLPVTPVAAELPSTELATSNTAPDESSNSSSEATEGDEGDAVAYAIDPVTGLPIPVYETEEPSAEETFLSENYLADIPTLTSDPLTLPPGPLPDGDLVITLAELQGIRENLDTNQMPAQYVIDNLSVSRGGSAQSRESHVLGVSFRHPDQVETRLVLEALLRSYQSFLSNKFQNVSREAVKLISQAKSELEDELNEARLKYRRFCEQSPILLSGEQTINVHRMAYELASTQMIEIESELAKARSRLEEVEHKLAERELLEFSDLEMLALIDDVNAARLSTLVAVTMGESHSAGFMAMMPTISGTSTAFFELAKAKAELESMLKDGFGPQHPEVIKLQARINVNESLVNSERQKLKVPEDTGSTVIDPANVMSAYLRLLRSDVASLERRQMLLSQMAAEEEERAKALYAYESEAEILRLEEARSQQLYDQVIDKLREINLAKDYTGFVNEVIESPEFGEEVWPSIPIVLALSTVLGLLCGLGTAAMAEYRDRSFKDPDDIRRDLDTTLLTHVPDLRGLARDPKQLVEGSQVHPSIYAFHKPKSREAEVFRGLRTSLFFSSSGQKCQVIMFTSPNQGDGKSTVASNLAVSIAQTGRKVLIVDCDLRRPNSHKLLGVKNDVGLSDVIAGEVEPMDAIKPTETTNLWCLPSGPLPANPAELLQSTRFEEFVKMAREKFDYVILDCPPVLAVADPCIVAPRADGITMVLRVSRDSRPQAARAKEMLMRVNGRLLGVVVNASEEAAKSGYGKYGDSAHAYSYDYGYGRGYGRGYNKYYEEDSTSDRASGR
jgi:polysaccharide biosynthesis transport protein